jgi:hypothetical protein
MKNSLWKIWAVLATIGGAALAIGLSGCGGGSTNSDSIGQTPSSGPAIYEYPDNRTAPVETSPLPAVDTEDVVSGLGTGSTVYPMSTDTYYSTFASTSTGVILPGAGGTVLTGLPGAGTYKAAMPLQTAVIFRASVVNGQTSQRSLIPIAPPLTLTEPGGGTQLLNFAYSDSTVGLVTVDNGPFIAAQYVTQPFTLSFAPTTGVYPLTVSVEDQSKNIGTTTFQIVVLASGVSAIGVTSTSTPVFTGGTPTKIYGPDANGSYIYTAAPGTYSVTTSGGSATGFVTTAGTLTVPSITAGG